MCLTHTDLVTFGYGLVLLFYYLSLCLSPAILWFYILFLLSCKLFYHNVSYISAIAFPVVWYVASLAN